MTYDEALQSLLDALLDPAHALTSRRVVVARDVRGRLRVCVDGAAPDGLEGVLRASLGGWFAEPLLATEGSSADVRFAAEGVLEEATGASWPREWPSAARVTADRTRVPSAWRGLRPIVAKGSWLSDAGGADAKHHHPRQPVVVGFHSYKGGVGRTTVVAMLAMLAASQGKKVVVVDLDLEAPGMHRVFDVSRQSAGTLDLLLEHQATDTIATVPTSPSASPQHDVMVVHAGLESATYLERLGHLDFASPLGAHRSGAARGLEVLVKKLAASKPDLIFLDTRAGLHDIGAIALRALAHVYVLVARESEQGVEGLEATLRLLHGSEAPVLLVQNFAHVESSARAESAARFRARCHALFRELGRFDDGDEPAEDDAESQHAPRVVPVLAEGVLGEAAAVLWEQRVSFEDVAKRLDDLVELVRQGGLR